MAIKAHPNIGTILTCDFNMGFREPEMVKRRPVVVISPAIAWRPGLYTVVGLSTTPPAPPRPYHSLLVLDPPLPPPWDTVEMWVKGDMIAAVGFHRLDHVRIGRDEANRRRYRVDPLSKEQIKDVQRCVLNSIGLFRLTKHL